MRLETIHGRDTFASYKSNVRKEYQICGTKETGHFDNLVEKD